MNIEQMTQLIAATVAQVMNTAQAAPTNPEPELSEAAKAQNAARQQSIINDAREYADQLVTVFADFDVVFATGLLRSLAERAKYDHFVSRYWYEDSEYKLQNQGRMAQGVVEYALDRAQQLEDRARTNAAKAEQAEIMMHAAAMAFERFAIEHARHSNEEENFQPIAPDVNISERAYVQWAAEYERKRAARNPAPSRDAVRQATVTLRTTERAWSKQ